MKRRGFFALIGKVAAAVAPLPLIARDMGDFNFLDSPGFPKVPEVVKKIPEVIQEPMAVYVGQLRFNITTGFLEFFDGAGWITPEPEVQYDEPEKMNNYLSTVIYHNG